MTAPALTIVPATTADHIDSIIEIERETRASVVALTHGHAVSEAMARGHDVVIALDGDSVIGWAWFALDEGRGGDVVGHLYRVAVALSERYDGIGHALVQHVRTALRDRGCTHVRATISADDGDALAFFCAAGFTEDAIIVEAPL